MLFTAQFGIWPWLFDKSDDFGVFLRLGGIEVRWYAICIFAGMYLCLMRCRRELKLKGISPDYYDNFFFSVIPIAILGARLWFVISCFDELKRDTFIKTVGACIGIENGSFKLAGLAIQGGVILGLIWGFIYFKFIKKRYPVGFHLDLTVPSILIGQVIGRWGNFFNGELFGTMVERKKLWWIPRFIVDNCTLQNLYSYGGQAHVGSQVGYELVNVPLFYIEGLINTVGYVLIGYVAWRFWKKFRKPYCIAGLYFVWYGVVRFFLEPLRLETFQMGTARQMAIVFVVIGLAMIIASNIIYRNVPYEKIYINEKYEESYKLLEKEKEDKLLKDIEAKKEEIRKRKQENKNE